MKAAKTRIFYTFAQPRSFINTDLVQLAKQYDLTVYEVPQTRKWLIPFLLVKQGIFLLVNGWRYKYFISFFAGFHSLLPSLFAKIRGKKSIIFLAGTDCFKYPSFNYGNYTKFWYGWFSCASARAAGILAPVSSNLVRSTSRYYTVDSIHQGIYHWCKDLKTPHKVIPFEYNPELFKRKEIERIPDSFISIAFGITGTSFIRKGIDKTIMLARHFPQHRFTIVGCQPGEFPVQVPSNVVLIPPVPHDRIPEFLSAHQFYLQLSVAEGFPSAICEAMLCECIPIGSDVAAIPLIIDRYGFIVEERNDEKIIEKVNEAINYHDKKEMGKQGREYIIQNFGPGRRINEIVELLETGN